MKTALIALAVFVAACSKQPDRGAQASTPAAATQTSLTAEQLGELGAAIRKNPNDATRLLSEKGMTAQTFAQAVRKVAEDPEASKRYAAAYKASP